MVLISSMFLTQLLCLIVPCDPQYKLPDTGPVTRKYGGTEYFEKFLKPQAEVALGIDNPAELHKKSFLGVRDLRPDPELHECLEENPLVTVQSGKVKGYRIQVTGGRKICAFEGIPYAEPPVGHLRFLPPVSKVPWKGSLDATKYGPQCLQYSVTQGFRVVGQEDCLFLNVYTVSQYVPQPLPVIVQIHGGGFFFGSSATYGPAYFMQRDIVLVTIQYRLGVLGFLSTGDSVCPGNFGLKDQALALKWVHENILAFGGDPERVTLLGQSAGGASVHLHMLSHSTRNYFRSAVSLSGSAFNYWSIFGRLETRNFTNTFAKTIGCPTEDSVKLMECFRERSSVELVTTTPLFLDDWPFPQNAFRPSIETVENNPSAFLTDYPENIYRRNEVANVPWIISTVSGEGYAFLLFPYITHAFPILQRNWSKLAADLVDADNLDVDHQKLLKRLTRFYFKNTPPEKAPISTYAQIVTDRSFLSGVYEAARAHVQVAPTYSYLFDFNGKYNMIVNYGYPASEWGVGHSEDIFYMFNATRIYSGFQREDLEYEISRTLVNLVSNFAVKGVPVYTSDTGEDLEVWLPHQDRNNLKFLGISKYIGMIDDPFKKRMRFWRSIRLPDAPANVIVEEKYHYESNVPKEK